MEQLQNNEIFENKNENIGYAGNVTLTVLNKNNKVVYTTKTHNNGKDKLFKCIMAALSGDFTTAKSLRPFSIVLFTETGYDSDGVEDKTKWTSSYKVSTVVPYDTVAVPASHTYQLGLTETKTSYSGYSVTYHFRIPFICISTSSKSIDRFGLYPETITDYYTDLLASFELSGDGLTADTKIDGNNTEIAASSKITSDSISAANSNWTLIVDWELFISNLK